MRHAFTRCLSQLVKAYWIYVYQMLGESRSPMIFIPTCQVVSDSKWVKPTTNVYSPMSHTLCIIPWWVKLTPSVLPRLVKLLVIPGESSLLLLFLVESSLLLVIPGESSLLLLCWWVKLTPVIPWWIKLASSNSWWAKLLVIHGESSVKLAPFVIPGKSSLLLLFPGESSFLLITPGEPSLLLVIPWWVRLAPSISITGIFPG